MSLFTSLLEQLVQLYMSLRTHFFAQLSSSRTTVSIHCSCKSQLLLLEHGAWDVCQGILVGDGWLLLLCTRQQGWEWAWCNRKSCLENSKPTKKATMVPKSEFSAFMMATLRICLENHHGSPSQLAESWARMSMLCESHAKEQQATTRANIWLANHAANSLPNIPHKLQQQQVSWTLLVAAAAEGDVDVSCFQAADEFVVAQGDVNVSCFRAADGFVVAQDVIPDQ